MVIGDPWLRGDPNVVPATETGKRARRDALKSLSNKAFAGSSTMLLLMDTPIA
jgi:hypothetical protein